MDPHIIVHCCWSVAKSYPILCSPMNCSSSCPLIWWCHPTISSPTPFAFNLSQHRGLFQWLKQQHIFSVSSHKSLVIGYSNNNKLIHTVTSTWCWAGKWTLFTRVSVVSLSAAAKSLQLCLTQCDPMDCSPPGCAFHGIFQARVLEWGAIAFSSDLFGVTGKR